MGTPINPYVTLIERIGRTQDEARSARTLARSHYQGQPDKLLFLLAHESIEAAENCLMAAKQAILMAKNDAERGDYREENRPGGVR